MGSRSTMGEALVPKKAWEPVSGGGVRAAIGRILSFACYPTVFPFVVFSRCEATMENTRWWRRVFAGLLFGLSPTMHAVIYQRCVVAPGASTASWPHLLLQTAWLLSFDHTMVWFLVTATAMLDLLSIDHSGHRLVSGRLHGPRVLVVGNGPSAVTGGEWGEEIDKFDEVIRFNNFQVKNEGLSKRVGTKTTVHYSDGMLYPTFKEYHVPGATVVLSLMMDRFFIAGSYVLIRGGADLQWPLVMKFFRDPNTTWLEKERIERLKKLLGLRGPKHPTSGMLAIDYFVTHPKAQLPVVIHGFDFFQGPHIHYFHATEPLYERINNHIGVSMHSPHLEKIYVEKLIAEGKVIFLKDWIERKAGAQ
mmetsp:Transcript_120195/g.347349  ORF Transcript_120195/g.347349 Transcript_120195/m.347349 type:complete len:362 (-) Transcript_120195:71-1156(-)